MSKTKAQKRAKRAARLNESQCSCSAYSFTHRSGSGSCEGLGTCHCGGDLESVIVGHDKREGAIYGTKCKTCEEINE